MSHRFRLVRARAFASLGAVAVAAAVIVAVMGSSGAVAGAKTDQADADRVSKQLATTSPTIPAKMTCAQLQADTEFAGDPALPDLDRIGDGSSPATSTQPRVLRRPGHDRPADALRSEAADQHLAGQVPAERMRRLLRHGDVADVPLL